MPKVSIIMPVYNTEKYLRRSIDSILIQTLSDVELILVDDGSTDQSPQICDEYAQKDSRVVVLHEQNSGPSIARNTALKVARGEFIGFVDSDDYIEPQTYELAVSHMEEDVELVIWNTNVLAEDNLEYTQWFANNYFQNKYSGKTKISAEIQLHSAVVPWNKLYRKSIIDEKEIIFPEGRLYEDNAFWCKYSAWCKNIYFLDAKLYFYNMRAVSLRGEVLHKKIDKEADRIFMVEDVYDYYQKHWLYTQENKNIIENLFLIAFNNAYNETSLKQEICKQACQLAIKMGLQNSNNAEIKQFAESLILSLEEGVKPVNSADLAKTIKVSIDAIKNSKDSDVFSSQQEYEKALNCFEMLILDMAQNAGILEEFEFLKGFMPGISGIKNLQANGFRCFEDALGQLYHNREIDSLIALLNVLQLVFPKEADILRRLGDLYHFVINDKQKAFFYYKKYTDIIKNNESVYNIMAEICAEKQDTFHETIYKQCAFNVRLGLS